MRNKLFSVLMTSEELKLFADFISEGTRKRREIPIIGRTKEVEEIPERTKVPDEEAIIDQEDFRRLGENAEEIKFVGENFNDKSNMYKLDGRSRMTKRYIKLKDPELQEHHRVITDPNIRKSPGDVVRSTGEIAKETANISGMLAKEKRLDRSGYDKKYAARGLETLLTGKIDADDAKDIVENRASLADSYSTNSDGYIKGSDRGIIGDLGRRWDDAKMVYGEALDGRSLGKDAAIAAGATAALGLGIRAIKKRRKRKKEEAEILQKKYRRES